MKKNIFLSKAFCIGFLAVAFVYGLILPFCWGNNPASEMGTLSLLCEDRKLFFWIWGILTSGSIITNTQYLYKKYNVGTRFYNILCVLAFISVCLIALTLGHSIEDWNPKRIAHWVATGVFIVLTFLPLLLPFIRNLKAYKEFKLYAICMVIILMSFIVIFVFVGKSALMEMIPIALVEIFLFAVNFTGFAKKKELQNA